MKQDYAQLNLPLKKLPVHYRSLLNLAYPLPSHVLFRPYLEETDEDSVDIVPETSLGRGLLFLLKYFIAPGMYLTFVGSVVSIFYFVVFVDPWVFSAKGLAIKFFGILFSAGPLVASIYSMRNFFTRKQKVLSERYGLFMAPDYILVRKEEKRCHFIPKDSVISTEEYRFRRTGTWNAGLKISLAGRSEPYGYLLSPDSLQGFSLSDIENWAPELFQGIRYD